MLAFRVSLNRKRVATTGIAGPHVLSAIVASVLRSQDDRLKWKHPSRFTRKELDLDLGGMISRADGTKEHVRWAHLTLKIGDTVTIKIVDSDRVDDPVNYDGVRVSSSAAPSNKPLKRMVGRRRPPTA